MNIKVQPMSTPIKVIASMTAKEIKTKKEEIFEKMQDSLPEIKGFRKGHIPREVAEKKFGVEKMYKKIIDELHNHATKENNIISSKDFKIFGDMSDSSDLEVEFVGEIEPKVELPDLKTLELKFIEEDITDKDIEAAFKRELQKFEKIEEIDRKDLQDLDFAEVDFEGFVEDKPFKGNSAKDYKFVVNCKAPSFIDNFEQQLIGMNVAETKEINVKFPDDYRDKTVAGKKAKFVVTLKSLKKKVIPEFTDDFAKERGYVNEQEYKKEIVERLTNDYHKKAEDNFKKTIVITLVENSKISPIPGDLLNRELEQEWRTFLVRMGQTEKEFLKKNPNGKEYYLQNSESQVLQLIKTTLVLKQVTKDFELKISEEDVIKQITNTSKTLEFSAEKIEKLKEELKKPEVYKIQERFALNEKAVDFLVEYFKK